MQPIPVQRTPKKTGQFSIKEFILQLLLLKDIHLAYIKTGLMRMMTKFRGFLKKNTDCTRHIKMILAQYPRKLPTATFVRANTAYTMFLAAPAAPFSRNVACRGVLVIYFSDFQDLLRFVTFSYVVLRYL